jgi:hypothetical protein
MVNSNQKLTDIAQSILHDRSAGFTLLFHQLLRSLFRDRSRLNRLRRWLLFFGRTATLDRRLSSLRHFSNPFVLLLEDLDETVDIFIVLGLFNS